MEKKGIEENPNSSENGYKNTNGNKLNSIKEKISIDPNYKIEDDDELWIKLQFIECLRDK